MERFRNSQIALKTTDDVKEKLGVLTTLMSVQAGYKMTQTQVLEKLIADEMVRQSSGTWDVRKTFVANHSSMMTGVTGLDSRVLMEMQSNANRLAATVGQDIRILQGAPMSAGDDPVFMQLAALFGVFSGMAEMEFVDENTKLYHSRLAKSLEPYFCLGAVCDHNFYIVSEKTGEVIGAGVAPYVEKEYDNQHFSRCLARVRDVLCAMMGLAMRGCILNVSVFGGHVVSEFEDRFIPYLVGPEESIYVPNVGDDEHHACTIFLFDNAAV